MSDSLQSALSDMQGQLFEMSIEKGLDSETFIKAFMLSDIASDLDSEFNHMQWAKSTLWSVFLTSSKTS